MQLPGSVPASPSYPRQPEEDKRYSNTGKEGGEEREVTCDRELGGTANPVATHAAPCPSGSDYQEHSPDECDGHPHKDGGSECGGPHGGNRPRTSLWHQQCGNAGADHDPRDHHDLHVNGGNKKPVIFQALHCRPVYYPVDQAPDLDERGGAAERVAGEDKREA